MAFWNVTLFIDSSFLFCPAVCLVQQCRIHPSIHPHIQVILYDNDTAIQSSSFFLSSLHSTLPTIRLVTLASLTRADGFGLLRPSLRRLASHRLFACFSTSNRPRSAHQPDPTVPRVREQPLDLSCPVFALPPLRQSTSRSNRRRGSRYFFPLDARYADHYPTDWTRTATTTEPGTVNMKFFLQFVSTPTADTPGTTLLLHFDDRRYLIGHTAEGTQRACVERGVRLTHLNDVFLTGTAGWKCTGGLLGLVLTLAEASASALVSSADIAHSKAERARARLAECEGEVAAAGGPTGSGKAKTAAREAETLRAQLRALDERARVAEGEVERRATLAVHGPPNVTHLLATARRFIFRKGMPLFVREVDDDGDHGGDGDDGKGAIEPGWQDDHIKVWTLPVSPVTSSTGSKSPRKRSLDEFQERNGQGDGSQARSRSADRRDRRLQDQIVRQAIVTEMFNSDWRMDALLEMPLRHAPRQATLFVRNPQTHKLEQLRRPLPPLSDPSEHQDDDQDPDRTVLVRKPWPGALVESLPPTSPSDVSVSYIIQHHDLRGKFDPVKAAALGVEPGPKYGKLARGETVTASDGTTAVTPDMVLGATQTGKALAVLDLPTRAHVGGLLARPEWVRNAALVEVLHAAIWILGPGVVGDERLQAFMRSPAMAHVRHIVSSADVCPNTVSFRNGATATIRFSLVDGERYRPPVYDNTVPDMRALGLPETAARAQPGLVVDFQPSFAVRDQAVPPPFETDKVVGHKNVGANVRRHLASPAFGEHLARVRAHQGPAAVTNAAGQGVEVIALGTGSSAPSKYRNVSATLVRVPGVGTYLLDCGENTLGQLRRLFGEAGTRDVLAELRLIWVSHLHADHHLGTASVVRAWWEVMYGGVYGDTGNKPAEADADPDAEVDAALRQRRLVVVSGLRMIDWMREYANVERYGFDRVLPLAAVSTVDGSRRGNGNGGGAEFFAYQHLNRDRSLRFDHKGDPLVTRLTFEPEAGEQPEGQSAKAAERSSLLRDATGLSALRTVLVQHCHDARAVVLTVAPAAAKGDGDGSIGTPVTVAYSGDCRPSPHFAAVGRAAAAAAAASQTSTTTPSSAADLSLLIHEATFENDMGADARAKRHSTVGDALGVARDMRARTVLLTHFSQRYQSVPNLGNGVEGAQGRSRSASQPGSQPTQQQQQQQQQGAPAPVTDVSCDVDDDGVDVDAAMADAPAPAPSAATAYDATLVPVVVAFDMMRLRLADAAVAEAQVPALMRTYVATESEEVAAEQRKDEEGDKETKRDKWNKGNKGEKGGKKGNGKGNEGNGQRGNKGAKKPDGDKGQGQQKKAQKQNQNQQQQQQQQAKPKSRDVSPKPNQQTAADDGAARAAGA